MSDRSAVLHRMSAFALQDAASADLVAGLVLAELSTRREAAAAAPEDVEPDAAAVALAAAVAARERAGTVGMEDGGERGRCLACRCQFESREEQVEHYKLDWHRFNLKLRLAGAATVSAEEFEERTGDISSISGSESDSDSEPWDSEHDPSLARDLQPQRVQRDGTTEEEGGGGLARPSQRVLFTNRAQQMLSLHRCVLHGKQETALDDAVCRLLALGRHTKWVVLMVGGGHFAGAVFQGEEVLQHKTFHRYTVRAKRGTAQGLRDAQSRSGMPKSAGASLRRYNEAALARDVRELLESWAPHVRDADAVFVRAASHSRALLFGARAPLLARSDRRVRCVPFATRRATHAEVLRVHRELAAVRVYAKGTDVAEILSACGRPWRRAERTADPATAAHLATPSRGGGTGDDAAAAAADDADDAADDDDDSDEGVTLQMSEESLSTAHLSEYDLQPSRTARRRAARRERNDGTILEEQRECSPTERHVAAPDGGAVDGADGSEDTGDIAVRGRVSHGSHKQEEQEKRRTKRREKKSKPSAATALTNALRADATEPGYYRVRDELYTACKVGDAETLRRILGPLLPRPDDDHPPAPPPPPPEGSSTIAEDPASGSQRVPSGRQALTRESAEEGGRIVAEGAAFPACSAEAVVAMLAETVGAAGCTLLHVAAASGQRAAARLLMEAGADPTIRDRKGRPAYCVSADKETRHEFRRYAARHPGQYDYARAQIPGPLTDEMENDRAERKRAQRAARRVKDRDQREEQRRREAEEAEQRRFAALSDREKRALAAEKRLAQQGASTAAVATAAATLTNIRRCWQCGQSLQEKMPFQYFDFSFCTVACLQLHKRSAAGAKP